MDSTHTKYESFSIKNLINKIILVINLKKKELGGDKRHPSESMT